MYQNRREKFIEISFAIVSVSAFWQLKLPHFFETAVNYLGASKESVLYQIIVNGGIPVSIVFISWISVKFYHVIIWPLLPNSNCQKGWWIYALIAQTEEEDIPVVGYFNLNHMINGIRIYEGHSYYAEGSNLNYRGRWNSDSVLINENRIRLLFNMHSINNLREIPTQYSGFIELKLTSDKPIWGRSSWTGYFQDLNDRRYIAGPIYAERLKKQGRKPGDKIQKMIHAQKNYLLSKAQQKIC